jgi:hypothetical protein
LRDPVADPSLAAWDPFAESDRTKRMRAPFAQAVWDGGELKKGSTEPHCKPDRFTGAEADVTFS